jgi:hypothetical protein
MQVRSSLLRLHRYVGQRLDVFVALGGLAVLLAFFVQIRHTRVAAGRVVAFVDYGAAVAGALALGIGLVGVYRAVAAKPVDTAGHRFRLSILVLICCLGVFRAAYGLGY